jgi:serine-type D-Ala-D-Ala carboxypeptidase/endopeptidase (penicillin-binding protein 4)
MKKNFSAIPLLFLCFGPIFAASTAPAVDSSPSFQQAIETLLASQKCSLNDISVSIKDLKRDTQVVSINADSLHNPASVMKLLTAAVALEKYGPEYCFSTRIFVDTIVPLDRGIGVRTLYIQGNGDPSFTVERLWLFVEHLAHCGVRSIDTMVLDDFYFDSVQNGPGFGEDTSSAAYQSLISALAMNFNTVAVHTRPANNVKEPVVVELFPEIKGLTVIDSAVTIAAKKKKDRLEVLTLPDSGSTTVHINGCMQIDEPGIYSFRKLWQTWESFGHALQPLFSRRGINFKGVIIHARIPDKIARGTPFYEFPSEPISDAVNHLFKYSSNFTAEMLFKSFSASRDSQPVQGSWEKSSAIVATWWKERNLPGKPIVQNGSGLGNTDRLSPNQVVGLLSYVWKQKTYLPEYLAALSNGGFDGTLKKRFTKSKLRGCIRAKTGTLTSYRVYTLGGYILRPRGEPIAFAILCHKTGRARWDELTIQEKILEKIGEMAGIGKE